MSPSYFHDPPIGEDAFHLQLEIGPFERPVKIIEDGGAASEQKFAKDGHVCVGQLHCARLDEVDPRMQPQLAIVKRENDRICDGNAVALWTRRDKFCSAAGASMAHGALQ
jgi:hypothetical protein